MALNYIEGDLFAGVKKALLDPELSVFIPHICNNKGGWGAGFVIPLGKNYPLAREAYREWDEENSYCFVPKYKKLEFALGVTQALDVEKRVVVFNMVAQKGFGPGRAVRYNALVSCMDSVYEYIKDFIKPQIHAPMFGAGLGGGNWEIIEQLVMDSWVEKGVETNIYYLPGTLPSNWKPTEK